MRAPLVLGWRASVATGRTSRRPVNHGSLALGKLFITRSGSKRRLGPAVAGRDVAAIEAARRLHISFHIQTRGRKIGVYEPVPCYNVLVNGTLSWRHMIQLLTLLQLKICLAMALAQSVRWSFQTWREHRVLDQIEPIRNQTILDDLKMASAVAIAAAVMVPAILVYAFFSWVIRSISNWSVRAHSPVHVTGVRRLHFHD